MGTKHYGVFSLILISFIYFLVLLVNDGFMALDEYWVGITRYIPAQSSAITTLVAADDVKSPLQLLPMHAVAQAALGLGIVSPYWQYRSVIFVLGILSIVLLIFGFLKYAKINNLKSEETNFLLFILTFYFAAPFALTRPMFESIAAPWLTLAAVMALRYDISEKLSDLLLGVFFVSVAFVLRQQLGFCALVFIILAVLKKNLKHVFLAGAFGVFLFVLSGIPDLYLRGQFHYSLLNLTIYNYEHGSDYGNRTVFFYPILIFVIAFIPFFIKKYPEHMLRDYFKKNRSLLMTLGLFVFLHSLFPQKWERFIISVIPILIFLVFPFLYYLHKNFKQHRVRLISLYTLNGFLFIVASFFPAQKNLIEMSLYLNDHSGIKNVFRVSNTPEWITEAFVLNKQFRFIDSNTSELDRIDWTDCSNAFVIGEAQQHDYKTIIGHLKLKAQFNVNLIEQLAFKLNPKNNMRRVRLSLYSGCDLI